MSENQQAKTKKRSTTMIMVLAAIVGLVISGYLLYVVADDSIMAGEQSSITEEFVDPYKDDTEEILELTHSIFPATFGKEGGARTLVLYDSESAKADLHGLGTANLVTHFGQATLLQAVDYQPGQMHEYDAAVYIGSRFGQDLPSTLISDMIDGRTKVLWAGANIEQLSGEEESPQAQEFEDRYGWLPSSSRVNEEDNITKVGYKDQELERSEDSGFIYVPAIVDPSKVEVLGTAVCGSQARPQNCEGTDGTEFPWVIRSENITYVADMPLDVIIENSHHLAYADLFYDLLAPETLPTQKAAVRFEDVGPEANPRTLTRVADYLFDNNIPFQVAVVPFHVSEVPGTDPVRHYGVSLLERPRVVKALKYMQDRGGTLIQHGTTHQYGAVHNPYQGATSGADYEFYGSKCSDNQFPPLELIPCADDAWVQLTGPVSADKVEDHAARLDRGRQLMIEAGLGEPSQFEVPHYSASPNAYQAISENYDYRYERVQYFPGLTSGVDFKDVSDFADFTQIFPYRVHDVYGSTVLPENLGNVAEEMQNNHPPRSPAFLIDNAKRNLVVRESTASFFFHPYLSVEYLEELVTGITGLGYTFVPSTEL